MKLAEENPNLFLLGKIDMDKRTLKENPLNNVSARVSMASLIKWYNDILEKPKDIVTYFTKVVEYIDKAVKGNYSEAFDLAYAKVIDIYTKNAPKNEDLKNMDKLRQFQTKMQEPVINLIKILGLEVELKAIPMKKGETKASEIKLSEIEARQKIQTDIQKASEKKEEKPMVASVKETVKEKKLTPKKEVEQKIKTEQEAKNPTKKEIEAEKKAKKEAEAKKKAEAEKKKKKKDSEEELDSEDEDDAEDEADSENEDNSE